MAARLLERAAREAARRAAEGDDAGVRVFCTQSEPALRDMMSDALETFASQGADDESPASAAAIWAMGLDA